MSYVATDLSLNGCSYAFHQVSQKLVQLFLKILLLGI